LGRGKAQDIGGERGGSLFSEDKVRLGIKEDCRAIKKKKVNVENYLCFLLREEGEKKKKKKKKKQVLPSASARRVLIDSAMAVERRRGENGF